VLLKTLDEAVAAASKVRRAPAPDHEAFASQCT